MTLFFFNKKGAASPRCSQENTFWGQVRPERMLWRSRSNWSQNSPSLWTSLEILKPGKDKVLSTLNQLVLPCPPLFGDAVIFPPGSLPGSQEMVVPNDLDWRWHLSVCSPLQPQPSNGTTVCFPWRRHLEGRAHQVHMNWVESESAFSFLSSPDKFVRSFLSLVLDGAVDHLRLFCFGLGFFLQITELLSF